MRTNSKQKAVVVKVQDMDISKILDTEKAIIDLGGLELYQLMLP